MGFTTRRRVSIPPPLNGTAPGATAEYLNRFSGRSLTPGILRHAVGATARLHDRRLASYSSQRLDAPAVWCSVFPPSFAARRVRPLMPRIVGWCSTGGILHTEGVAADAPTPPHPCEGGRGMKENGSAGVYAPTLPF